ncbi:MAG: CPBP family intramembrane metalloprotease [Methanobrevibacter sp.]|nr:CPBP family intramembrane metalloprotease [Methanobrevibacter sp.]MBQ2226331.1 CPBP family intramembrane metalloprotease [Methanobrevibacter sp.]MBQ2353818.1 CPBP family intramembrane metalloprotease [Methanobrevibacter sp.]
MDKSKLLEKTEKDYTTFPLTLETYSWFKPILIAIIAVLVAMVVSFALLFIIRADATQQGIMRMIYAAITMIALIPGIYIGYKLLYKIPFSTQVAPTRKWNWGIYIKAFIITVLVYGVIQLIPMFISGIPAITVPPIAILILCLILPIFQGFSEEFLCRGLLMQTFGSWFKIPIVAIVIQAAIFAVLHPYQLYALIGVFCTGLLYGLITWYGQGLESSSAMHAVNNIFAFLAMAVGLQQGAAESSLFAFVMNLVVLIIPIIIVIALDKKFNLFGLKE